MGSWKAWKTKASAWLKRALIILAVTIATLVGVFIVYKISVGVLKESYRKKIANYEAQLSIPPISQGYGVPVSQGYGVPNPPMIPKANVTF